MKFLSLLSMRPKGIDILRSEVWLFEETTYHKISFQNLDVAIGAPFQSLRKMPSRKQEDMYSNESPKIAKLKSGGTNQRISKGQGRQTQRSASLEQQLATLTKEKAGLLQKRHTVAANKFLNYFPLQNNSKTYRQVLYIYILVSSI